MASGKRKRTATEEIMPEKKIRRSGKRDNYDEDETGYLATVRLHFLLRLLLGLLLSALGAAMLVLAFPPYGIWPLIFLGFVPILISLHRVLPRRLSGLAPALGIGGFAWGYLQDIFTGTGYEYISYLPYAIALFALIVGSQERDFHERTRYRFFIVQGAVVWVGIEFIRGLIPFVGTWGFVAYPLYEQFWFIQPVSFFSIYGLSLLVMIVNFTLGYELIARFDALWCLDNYTKPVSRVGARLCSIVTGILLLCWTIYSLILLDYTPVAVRVAAIQPGLFRQEAEINEKTTVIERERIEFQEDLDQLLAQTREAAALGARFIVWPEGILPVDPQERGAMFFQNFAVETDAFLAMGYTVTEDINLHDDEYQGGGDATLPDESAKVPETVIRNEAVLLSPDGVFLSKVEMDYPAWFFLNRETVATPPVYQTLIGSLGIAFSHDMNFTYAARDITRNGARFIAVLSRDRSIHASRQYTHMVFRAVENRVSLIRADAHYASAIVDPYGRIVRRTVSRESKRINLVADIPVGDGDTFVVNRGDWVGWLCLIGLFLFLLLQIFLSMIARRKSEREKRAFSVVS